MRKLTKVKLNLHEGRGTALETGVVSIQQRKKTNIRELEETGEEKTTLSWRREDDLATW